MTVVIVLPDKYPHDHISIAVKVVHDTEEAERLAKELENAMESAATSAAQ